jgi:hypothetical protein
MVGRPPQTQRGHEEPFAVQFSIFLANRVGQLKDLLDLFMEKGLSTLGLSIVDASEWAVIRTICSDPDKAREVLRGRGIPFTENRVILVELPDDESLAALCSHLLRAELNINFAYPLTMRSHGNAVMALHVDERTLAVQALTRHGFVLLGEEDLADRL